ncbi:S49 family peptidase [Azospirillum doebereinerae]|uniref:S49 family peptidase n=1 Tax=Azospirillum doebereinerae TaxID=92933 RepID=A0A433J1C8_9PROT|nr:S49 family peptidase [Azospirillum doebereinerae]RUQ63991.1 S49 family peptidase [Azospirillum doebereinerae]
MTKTMQPVLVAPAWAGTAAARMALLQQASVDMPVGCYRVGDVGGNRRPYEVDQGVAVVSVAGLLVPKLGYWGGSWATGYDGLRYQLAHAFGDPDVRAICLDIDSGGGIVNGCFDLVDWIAAEKVRASKTVAAICSEEAYSAAYAIGCAADTISVPRTGGVGSIGVWQMHWDYSRMLDEAGLKPSIVQSGAHKTDGHPYAALPEAVRADWQAQVDGLRQLFAATVARLRGLDVAAVLATEGRCFEGPAGTAEAVRLGLADAVLPPAEAFSALLDHVRNTP